MPTIEVRGVEAVRAAISGIAPAINAAIRAVAMEIKGKIADYPPPPENSSYRRTMTLFRRWTVKFGPFTATIGNNTPYGPFVQDREKQAGVHQGRWQTTQDVTDEYDPIVSKLLEDTARKAMRK